MAKSWNVAEFQFFLITEINQFNWFEMMNPVKSVGAFEAKTKLSSLLREVRDGQTFQISVHGKEVAELRPLPQQKAPQPGGMKGFVTYMADDFDDTPEGFEEYMP